MHISQKQCENLNLCGNMQEGIAVGRSFATFKSYHIDGNKEMIAFGMMNIAGSCTSCYLTTGNNIYNKILINS